MIEYTALSADTAHIIYFIFEWLGVLIGVQSYRQTLPKRFSPARFINRQWRAQS